MKKSKSIKIVLLITSLVIFYQFSNISLAKTAKITSKTSKVTEQTKVKKTKAKNYQNGNLSNKISISEIFPNPKGTDTDKEWIELYNPENHNVNLGNWRLVITNTKKGTKPKIIKLSDKITVAPHSYLILDSSNSKFSLLNSNCKIELRDFVEKNIDTVNYAKTKEDLSLSKIQIKGSSSGKNLITWTNPTKNKPNPIFYKLSGTIQETITETAKNTSKHLKIKIKTNEIIKVYIPKTMNFELIQNTLNPGTTALFLIEKNKNQNYSLVDFKITKQAKTTSKEQENKEEWLYYSLIPILTILIWLLHKTFNSHRLIDNLRDISSR